MSTSRSEIILAYRHVYKALLRAVQYSKPARFVARDRVRLAFRDQPSEKYNAARVARTLEFLDGAARVRGLEHRIVKNLMHVWWEQRKLLGTNPIKDKMMFRKVAYEDFNHTIRMMEDSMGLNLG